MDRCYVKNVTKKRLDAKNAFTIRIYACLTPSQRTNTQTSFSDPAVPSDIKQFEKHAPKYYTMKISS